MKGAARGGEDEQASLWGTLARTPATMSVHRIFFTLHRVYHTLLLKYSVLQNVPRALQVLVLWPVCFSSSALTKNGMGTREHNAYSLSEGSQRRFRVPQTSRRGAACAALPRRHVGIGRVALHGF
jgi:hypothetical protein